MTRGQFDAATVAVVCVECQNGVLGPEAVLPALTAETADLIGNLRRLLDAARATRCTCGSRDVRWSAGRQ